MSFYVNSTDRIPGKFTCVSYGGLGYLAENVPADGAHGPAYAYNSLTVGGLGVTYDPANNGKEIQGRITGAAYVVSGPGTLNWFKAFDDTSILVSVTDDCTIGWPWDLYVDGALDTAGLTGTVTIGASASFIPAWALSRSQILGGGLR